MKKRKIIFITGARSEYDIMYPVLEQLSKASDIDLKIIVTGAHLSELYGKTIINIESDNFTISDKIYNLINSNEKVGRVIGMGTQITGLAHSFHREKPDIVIVVGDREEAITVSLTAAFLNIPVAHLAGGDVAYDGNIDNTVRYATSKFSHIHFTFLEQHAQVLRLLGEDEFRIFNLGNPALDKFMNCPWLRRNEIKLLQEFNIKSDEKYLMLVQHPIITEVENASFQVEQSLQAVLESGMKCFVNFPNSDAGNFSIIEMINSYAKKFPENFFIFKNLDRLVYINLMRHSSCLIGNSSSGIIEAPSIGLPVVNVGTRQRGRINAGNVIFTDYIKTEILKAILYSVNDENYRNKIKTIKNPYGDGNSSEKICEVLRNITIDDKLIYKNITYKV